MLSLGLFQLTNQKRLRIYVASLVQVAIGHTLGLSGGIALIFFQVALQFHCSQAVLWTKRSFSKQEESFIRRSEAAVQYVIESVKISVPISLAVSRFGATICSVRRYLTNISASTHSTSA